MPNIKQQKKRMRLAEKQRLRNRQVKSSIRTLFAKLQASVAANDDETAQAVAKELTTKIDKAVSKGVLHKNSAAHKKSRVARICSSLSA